MARCLACSFHNPDDGPPNCFQCGQRLNWDDVETEPEALRRPRGSRDLAGILRRDLARTESTWNSRFLEVGPFLTSVIPFMLSFLLPGLGQLFNRAYRKAPAMFAVWALTLLWEINYGVSGGVAYRSNWMLASVHSWAMMDAYFDCRRRFLLGGRHAPMGEMAVLSLISVALTLAYNNLTLVGFAAPGHNRVQVAHVASAGPGLEDRDELLLESPPRRLHEGMIVVYAAPLARGYEHVNGGSIGQVLAVAGDVVVLERGAIRVNAHPVAGYDLPRAHDDIFQVAPGHALVWSTLPLTTELREMVIDVATVNAHAYRIAAPFARRRNLP